MVYKFSKEVKMNNKEFMESVKRTWKLSNPDDIALKEDKEDLTHAIMGLSAEAGELMDEFKKWRFYNDGRSFPQKRLEEELGDVLYYVFALCHELRVKPEDIMWMNRNKLRERYAITSKLPPNCS
jgi:NTP pyrophosphatase (non-canonical NTP hydrolase)